MSLSSHTSLAKAMIVLLLLGLTLYPSLSQAVLLKGQLSISIKSGSFKGPNDLRIHVFLDGQEVGRTDQSDGFSPSWDATIQRAVDGDYKTLTFAAMDEDTFSWDDKLGSSDLALDNLPYSGDLDMVDSQGASIGRLSVAVTLGPSI